jgi:hypothetical protein
MVNIVEAARSTIPFRALNLTIEDVVRHPDTRTIEFMVFLKTRNDSWEPADNGKSTTKLTLAAVSVAATGDILASKLESLTVTADTQDPDRLAQMPARLSVKIRLPRKTQSVRVVVQTQESDRIGTAELDRKTIDAAPEVHTSEPELITRPHQHR